VQPNELTHHIIGAAIEVHRELGPGKIEAVYETALCRELYLRGIPHQPQKPFPVIYKGIKLDCGYHLDTLVDNTVVVEAKAVEAIHPIHRAQGLTYLKLGGWNLALLLNFNVAVLKDGIERLVSGFKDRQADPLARPNFDIASVPNPPRFRSTTDSGDSDTEQLATEIIAAALEVHRALGPGLLPSAYEVCLCHELHLRGVMFERKRSITLSYKGVPLETTDELELLVGGRVAVSTRAVSSIEPVHECALLSQLRFGGWKLGLLINFNTILLKEGIRRIVIS